MRTVFILLSFVFISFKSFAQAEYIVSQDPKNPEVKILKGTINKNLLQNDTAFSKWYNSSQSIYSPDTSIINAFKRTSPTLHYILFGGTWCDDTQFVLPRFFKLQEMAGIPDDNITFFGVDRNKKALGHIAEAFGIINVPTIIIMKEGKELGRVVEYGKTGKWDKELADIINSF